MPRILEMLKKRLIRKVQAQVPTDLWESLRHRVAAFHIEHKQASVVAWMMAQCIGRLNLKRKSRRSTNICFCCSTLHALCNIAAPHASEQNTIFFYTLYARHLHTFICRLGFGSYSGTDYSVALIMLREAIRGRQIVVWIPHLSPLDFSLFAQKLIRGLSRFNAVRYIDDGMGFISRETLIYRMSYISKHEHVHSWDFTFLPSELGFPSIVSRSSFTRALEFVRSRYPSLISQGLAKTGRISAPKPGSPINIILATKLLDAEACMRQVEQSAPLTETFYIPHYNVNKNYPTLALSFPNLKLDMPEFGLLGIAEALPCRIFFGVTSSAILLLELILRTNSSQALEFIFAGEHCCEEHYANELMSFQKLLRHYQKQQALRDKSISIVIL